MAKRDEFTVPVRGSVVEVRLDTPTEERIRFAASKGWEKPEPCWYADVLYKNGGVNQMMNLPFYENKPALVAGKQYDFTLNLSAPVLYTRVVGFVAVVEVNKQ